MNIYIPSDKPDIQPPHTRYRRPYSNAVTNPDYPTCVMSAQAAWDNSGSLDIQPTTTLGISYPYCVAGNVTAGLPGAMCKDYNLASPQHTATFSMALQLADPRPLNAKSCFLLSGANAFSPVRGGELSVGRGVEGWTIGTVSDATCGTSAVTKQSRMVSRLCRGEVANFTTPYANNTVVSGQVRLRILLRCTSDRMDGRGLL